MATIELIRLRNAFFCVDVSNSHWLRSFCWSGVTSVRLLLSDKNWAMVISKAEQIFSNDGSVGSIFLRYQEEMVDCGIPDFCASWYSVQLRDKRCWVMRPRMSIIMLPPDTSIYRYYSATIT